MRQTQLLHQRINVALLLLSLLLLLTAFSSAGAAEVPPSQAGVLPASRLELPDTAAGQRLDALIQALNCGDPIELRASAADSFKRRHRTAISLRPRLSTCRT
jgi:hypothetical protein